MSEPAAADEFTVILNSASGCGHDDRACAAIETEFRTAGRHARVTRVNPDAIQQTLEQAVRDGVQVIVVGGGDGTLSTAASALAGSDTALGVLPLGTLNHFAKDQQIPLDLAGAVRTIVAGNTEQVDVGDVNGHTFINNSSLGLYPDIVSLRKRLGVRKWIGMLAATWQVLGRVEMLDVRVTSATGEHRYRTPFAFIGNNEYVVEGLELGARKSLQGGTLSLYTARRAGRLGMLWLALQALFGRLQDSDDFHTVVADDIMITTRRPRLRVAIDGEVCHQDMPLHYRSRPGALRVLVPRAAPGETG